MGEGIEKKNPSSTSHFQAAKLQSPCLNNDSGEVDHYGVRGQSKEMLFGLIQNIKLPLKQVV